jgi:hypothetical protein
MTGSLKLRDTRATSCPSHATVCHLFSSLERGNAKGDSRHVMLCFKRLPDGSRKSQRIPEAPLAPA